MVGSPHNSSYLLFWAHLYFSKDTTGPNTRTPGFAIQIWAKIWVVFAAPTLLPALSKGLKQSLKPAPLYLMGGSEPQGCRITSPLAQQWVSFCSVTHSQPRSIKSTSCTTPSSTKQTLVWWSGQPLGRWGTVLERHVPFPEEPSVQQFLTGVPSPGFCWEETLLAWLSK